MTFTKIFSFALIAASLGFGVLPAFAQDTMKKDAMHEGSMKKDSMMGHKHAMKHHTMKKDSMHAHSMKKDMMKQN